MHTELPSVVFGPIDSRRLGKSLGVNNIPPKICTCSCIYCQAGSTNRLTTERQTMYEPEWLHQQIGAKLADLANNQIVPDYISVVPDGEPTLDIHLGSLLDYINSTGIKSAVITSSMLLWRSDVRNELDKASLVSVKADTAFNEQWHKLMRPSNNLTLHLVWEGITAFAKQYKGHWFTETMLVKGVNDSEDHLLALAHKLAALNPPKSFIGVPTRPPQSEWVEAPSAETLNLAYQIFKSRGLNAELLTGFEKPAMRYVGEPSADLLSILAVHPLNEDEVLGFFDNAEHMHNVVSPLLHDNIVVWVYYSGKRFLMPKHRLS